MDVLDEANRIKDRLRLCRTISDVETVADEERANVKIMAESDEGKPLAIQIANLKAYRIGQIKND